MAAMLYGEFTVRRGVRVDSDHTVEGAHLLGHLGVALKHDPAQVQDRVRLGALARASASDLGAQAARLPQLERGDAHRLACVRAVHDTRDPQRSVRRGSYARATQREGHARDRGGRPEHGARGHHRLVYRRPRRQPLEHEDEQQDHEQQDQQQSQQQDQQDLQQHTSTPAAAAAALRSHNSFSPFGRTKTSRAGVPFQILAKTQNNKNNKEKKRKTTFRKVLL